MLCDRTFAGETLHRELETDQSMEITKVQLGEPVSFTAIPYRIMGEGSPKPTPLQNGDNSRKLRSWSALRSLPSLPAAQLVGECPSQVTLV